MGLNPSILHAEHIARLMKPEQRRALGVQTTSEASAKAQAGEEDDLQSDIRQYLNLHRIEFITPGMRRKSALPPGWPDFTFSYRGRACAVEAKAGTNKLDPDQIKMRDRMQQPENGWHWIEARSVADVQALFRQIDQEST